MKSMKLTKASVLEFGDSRTLQVLLLLVVQVLPQIRRLKKQIDMRSN